LRSGRDLEQEGCCGIVRAKQFNGTATSPETSAMPCSSMYSLQFIARTA
jgi:hypothetical protein